MMRRFYLFIFIFLFCISVSLNIKHYINPFDYKTQADMIKASGQINEVFETEFDKICDRIIETFKADENFIQAFKADKEAFLEYRKIQANLILPAVKTEPNAYGSNYPVHLNSYYCELTEKKIQEYKRAIEMYCLYNDCYQPDGICIKENIDKIFNQ